MGVPITQDVGGEDPLLQRRPVVALGPVLGHVGLHTGGEVTFMTWNLLHLARMLRDAGGIPAHGNQRSRWADGERFGFHHPEYR